MKEYTVSTITEYVFDDQSVGFSANLIDENGISIPVEISKSNTGSFVAFTKGGVLLPLYTKDGERVKSIKEYDSVFIDEAVTCDLDT